MTRARVVLAYALAALALAGAGCNTVEGLGKDTEAAGEAIQRGAKDVKEKMSE